MRLRDDDGKRDAVGSWKVAPFCTGTYGREMHTCGLKLMCYDLEMGTFSCPMTNKRSPKQAPGERCCRYLAKRGRMLSGRDQRVNNMFKLCFLCPEYP